jgi:hypothetical protein
MLCDMWGNDSLYEIICQQSNALKNPRILPESLLDKLAIQKCLRFRSRLRIDLEMIDPFKISLDIRDRGWVSEAVRAALPIGNTPPP